MPQRPPVLQSHPLPSASLNASSSLLTQQLVAGASLLGRYRLQKVLGKGAQATVWLAHDDRLQRDVALKLMRLAPGSASQGELDAWLDEARSLGRLRHPNIVTLHEADLFEGQPGMVLEYVPGKTLAGVLQERGRIPAGEAVGLLRTLLDALQSAHGAGVIHRDIKPSNILLDGGGQPKLMDFGIASRAGHPSGQRGGTDGTPGYLSPEVARGEAALPASDVFAIGLVLAEMLFGRPVVEEADPYRAIYRIAHEDLTLPAEAVPGVDDALRAIVLRALARDLAKRYASAADMAQELKLWMEKSGAADASTEGGSGTLDFLLRRMRHKSDFPAMSEQIVRVQTLASSENESLNSLTSEILKDVALTNKLLRMVNSAHFASSAGSVSTVSRAVSLVGFAGIRNIALSLVLVERMQNQGHAQQIKTEFLRSLLAGNLASGLSSHPRESEEVFIGALFQNLGRLLTEFYFPEEAQQVRTMRDGGALEEEASKRVLGLSFEALGLGVARTWGLPPEMQALMRHPTGNPPGKPAKDAQERMRWVVQGANELADAFLTGDPGTVEKVAKRYSASLGLRSDRIMELASDARQKLTEMADVMGVRVAPHSPAAHLLAEGRQAPPPAGDPDELKAQPHAPAATAPGQSPEEQARQDPAFVAEVLATGIQDVTNAMVDNVKLNDVIRMILETMYRALGFRRVLFCLRDPASGVLLGRFGLGDQAQQVAKAFRIPLSDPSGLFSAVCLKGVDTLIRDSSAPNVAGRLPPWYQQSVHAPSFLLLPMMNKGAPFGLIYADKASTGGIQLEEKELALLKTLRNQAVMAFRQSR